MRGGAIGLAAALAAALSLLALPATGEHAAAERAQRDNLIVVLDGGVSPLALPRERLAPVAVNLGGSVQTRDGSPLPRLDRVKIALAARGVLSTRGLPLCPRDLLHAASSGQALAACRAALVGRGKLHAKIYFPGQDPFDLAADLLAFNGRTATGRRAVWILIYPYRPALPTSFVIPLTIDMEPGRGPGFSKANLTVHFPRSIRRWPRLARFRFTFHRRYSYQGRRRSYISASCPVPKSFNAGFLAFAKATYSFADGRDLEVEAVRSCRAR